MEVVLPGSPSQHRTWVCGQRASEVVLMPRGMSKLESSPGPLVLWSSGMKIQDHHVSLILTGPQRGAVRWAVHGRVHMEEARELQQTSSSSHSQDRGQVSRGRAVACWLQVHHGPSPAEAKKAVGPMQVTQAPPRPAARTM